MREIRAQLDGAVSVRAEPNGDGRIVDIRLLTWNTVAETNEGRELFEPGAFADTDPELVTIESQRHDGALVGRGFELSERDDAPYLSSRISRTPAGDEMLTLINDGVLRRASIVFAETAGGTHRRADGVTVRRRVDLRRVAILERGAHPGAGVVAVRREPTMPEDQTEHTGAPAPVPVAAAVDITPLSERMERIESRIGQIVTMQAPVAVVEYRADTLGQLLFRSWSDPDLRRVLADGIERNPGLHRRALVDQITPDNPGLVRPAVIRDAALIVSWGRPSIDGVGSGPLPADGMTVEWPVLTTPMTGLIAKVAAQKTAITSAKVSFGNASAPIGTFAGGSDISYQLIRRSSPPYLAQYARVMLAAYAHVTNQQFVTDLAAAATGGTVVIGAASDAAAIVAALVDASLKVQTATGQPATFVGVASDLFAAIAKVWAPTSINPTATGGTAMASTLRVSVSGLEITHDPFLPAGTGLITNRVAAEWLEDGPFSVAVDDVEKLGQNTAYWGLGVSAVYVPAGVVKVGPAGP